MTPTTFGDQTGELLLFIQQNRQLCDHLVQSRGIASVRVGLRKTLPQVKHDEVEYSRTWLRFATAEMESLMADGYWPIFLNVRRDTQSDEANTRFTIRLIWVTGQFHKDNCDVEALRQHMAKVFPGLDKFGGSEYRRLVLASKLNTADAISKARQFAAEIDNAIAAARKSGIIRG